MPRRPDDDVASNPSNPRVLLLTNQERGEANVFLAVAATLLEQNPSVELHFASFAGLEAEVAALSARLSCPIHFHTLQGYSMTDGIHQHAKRSGIALQHDDVFLPVSFAAPVSFRSTLRAIRDTIPIFLPYGGPEFVEIYTSIVDLVKHVAPDLVVVDSLMTAGLTACHHLNATAVCLSPNAIKDLAAPSQPNAASLWKFPAYVSCLTLRTNFIHDPILLISLPSSVFSGISYPVPWYLWPLNVFFVLYFVKTWIGDAHRKQLTHYLRETTGAVLKTTLDLTQPRGNLNLPILVSTWPELDFPLVIPEHILPCGPIVRKNMSVAESDSGLCTWVAQAPTIYINLGSLCKLSEERALQTAQALDLVLTDLSSHATLKSLQVLWKLKKLDNFDVLAPGCAIHSTLGKYAAQDRVRIYEWIEADPFSLLESGNIVCAVHHGGANSFNEAILAGVPQVILPQWTDCYDYAQRVQLLGVGRQGDRRNQPQWSAQGLSQTLLEVIAGPDAGAMRQRASYFAELCKDKGDGAANAARFLLQKVAVAAKGV